MLLAWASAAPSSTSGEGPYDTLRIEAMPPVEAAGGPDDGRWTILLDGYIDALAANRLGALVAHEGITEADVYFNSPGGSLIAGMEIGRLLRRHAGTTRTSASGLRTYTSGSGVCATAPVHLRMPEVCGGTWSSIRCSAFTAPKTACHCPTEPRRETGVAAGYRVPAGDGREPGTVCDHGAGAAR